jgi:hypothetical protein
MLTFLNVTVGVTNPDQRRGQNTDEYRTEIWEREQMNPLITLGVARPDYIKKLPFECE